MSTLGHKRTCAVQMFWRLIGISQLPFPHKRTLDSQTSAHVRRRALTTCAYGASIAELAAVFPCAHRLTGKQLQIFFWLEITRLRRANCLKGTIKITAKCWNEFA